MARKVDITDKLTFEGNPSLLIKDKELEVNSDAPTMLKVMNLMENGKTDMKSINAAYHLVFPEESRKKLDELKLDFSDWITVIQEAISLVTGEDTDQGEH